jgi:hypothetical protein
MSPVVETPALPARQARVRPRLPGRGSPKWSNWCAPIVRAAARSRRGVGRAAFPGGTSKAANRRGSCGVRGLRPSKCSVQRKHRDRHRLRPQLSQIGQPVEGGGGQVYMQALGDSRRLRGVRPTCQPAPACSDDAAAAAPPHMTALRPARHRGQSRQDLLDCAQIEAETPVPPGQHEVGDGQRAERTTPSHRDGVSAPFTVRPSARLTARAASPPPVGAAARAVDLARTGRWAVH